MAVSDLRKIEVRPRHSRHWLWYVTATSFVTGALLAASIRTQNEWRQQLPDVRSWRPESIASQWKAAQEENQRQKRDIEVLRARAVEMEAALSSGSRSQGLINEELQRSKVLLGFTELKGPGITLTLKDSTMKPPSTDLADQESFILHDYDLQRVVNELNVAGAEAISINGQRLVSRTGIRCVGPVAHINSVPVAPPFVIKAIGDPEVLRSALLIRGGIIDGWLKPLGFPVDIQTSQDVHVPAYTGAVELRYAQSVTAKPMKDADTDGGSKQ